MAQKNFISLVWCESVRSYIVYHFQQCVSYAGMVRDIFHDELSFQPVKGVTLNSFEHKKLTQLTADPFE